MVFVDKHFKFILDFLVVLVDIIAASQLLNRFCQFSIYLNQLFQRLLQLVIFLLELIHFFPQLFVVAFTGKIVFETIGHYWIIFIRS